MTYSVGNSSPANYANTSSGKVTNVVADGGVGGSGESVNVVDRAAASLTIATNTQNALINVSTLTGYTAGKTDITITVNSGVYVWGTSPTTSITTGTGLTKPIASMEIIGGSTGDKINIVNNGNIIGYGGNGGGASLLANCGCSYIINFSVPIQGGSAISTVYPINSIVNNGYIAGGGGGGGASLDYLVNNAAGGGGGAGGGISPNKPSPPTSITPSTGTGNNGTLYTQSYGCCNNFTFVGGGGGGFTLPGTGGAIGLATGQQVGIGGGSGGSGGGHNNSTTYTNNGGSAGNNATTPTQTVGVVQGGGGGGWSGSGANGYISSSLGQIGTAGGYAIITNGNAVSAPTGSGTVYGTTNTTLRSVVYTFTSSDYQTFSLDTIPGMAAGSDVILVVPSNVKLYSSDVTQPALTLTYSTYTPNSVRVIVNGSITGMGGYGGGNSISAAGVGGDAIALGTATYAYNAATIFDCTNGYIAGGGGGGGESGSAAGSDIYGGGGAGGGSSGLVGSPAYNAGATPGTSTSGNNGFYNSGSGQYSGGSGGTILPGTRTTSSAGTSGLVYPGLGGQAGGAGAFQQSLTTTPGNYGGGFNENGGFVNALGRYYAGGGGGWGASGGNGYRTRTLYQAGGVGGYAVKKYSTSNPNMYIINSINIGGTVA